MQKATSATDAAGAMLSSPPSFEAPRSLPSFYKRPLPTSCIAFDSAEGRELFGIAMQEGNMETYFSLAQSFLTQNEPAYCGLATLCMILNALGVDPQKQFKGPWRYYSQEMLDCCRTLADVAESGITLAEFACLARCNGLNEHTRYGNSVSIEDFTADVEHVCSRGDGSVMAVAYSRKALGQTGDGHFSPIGGYCKSRGKVLVLDVARFKYPSYWVSLDDLYQSLQPIDRATQQPRGYSILRMAKLSPSSKQLPMTGLLSLNFNKQTWPTFLEKLRAVQPKDAKDLVQQVVSALQDLNLQPLEQRAFKPEDIQTAEDQQQLDPVPTKLLSDAYVNEIQRLVLQAKAMPAWHLVAEAMREQGFSTTNLDLPYPAALEYTIFVMAVLTSSGCPPFLRNLGQAALPTTEGRIKQEIDFLHDQMASLEKCCSTEKSCACMGAGLPAIACKTTPA